MMAVMLGAVRLKCCRFPSTRVVQWNIILPVGTCTLGENKRIDFVVVKYFISIVVAIQLNLRLAESDICTISAWQTVEASGI